METMKIKRRFFHGYSNGKRCGVIFCKTVDYVEAMNRLALCAARYKGKVHVVAFCFMPTHVHILLFGDAQSCAMFLDDFTSFTVRYLNAQPGLVGKGDEFLFELREVAQGDDVRSECAYILRNPTQAGLPYLPWEYPWSSGPLYYMRDNWYYDILEAEFSSSSASEETDCILFSNSQGIKKVGALANKVKAHIFHTKSCEVPDDWSMYMGLVLPGNYIDAEFAGFSRKKDFLFHVGRIRDDKYIDELNEINTNATAGLGDLKALLTRMFVSRYSSTPYKRVRDLPFEERQALAVELHNATKGSIWFIAKAAQLRFDEAVAAIWE